MNRFLRIFSLSLAAALMAVALAGSSALAAATIHSLDVTFTQNSPTVTATIDVSGLGSTKPAFATLNVFGFAIYECSNKGGNAAPGQNPVPASTASAPAALNNTTQNGRGTATVTSTLTAPGSVSPQTAGCPNGNWAANLQSVTVTGASLVITQQGQTVFSSGVIDNPYQP